MTPFRYAELFDKGPRWYVYFWAKNPESGKLQRVRHYINSQKTLTLRKKLALQIIRTINDKLDQGWNPFISDSHRKMFTPLFNALDDVLAYKIRYLRKRSLPNYKSRLDRIKTYLTKLGKKDINCMDFTEGMAQDYMNQLLKSEAISPRTFNNILTDYRTFWNYLIKTKHCQVNVFRAIDRLPETAKRKRPFSPQEAKKYRSYLQHQDPNFLITSLLCYYCGLRPNEITLLKVRDVKSARQLIDVDPSISKNKKQRMVPVASSFWPLLAEYIKGHDPNSFLVSKNFSPGQQKIHPIRIAEHFRKIAIHLNFDQDLKFYSLKDTCADALDQAGYSTKTIRDLFGHSSVAVTDNYMKSINTRALDQVRDDFPEFGK